MSAYISQEQKRIIQGEFREYLEKEHPDWKESYVEMHSSDSFYVFNNDIGMNPWSCFESDASLEKAREGIREYLRIHGKSDKRANGYIKSMQMLKLFLDQHYPGFFQVYRDFPQKGTTDFRVKGKITEDAQEREITGSNLCPLFGGASTGISAKSTENSANINPDDVVAWLVTQPNSNGKLYLKNVVRQYMYSLSSGPLKLEMPIAPECRNVFACHTADELTELLEAFKKASNYKQVNNNTSGKFSAGMDCLLRYLEALHSVGDSRVCNAVVPQSESIDFWNSGIETAVPTCLVANANYSPKSAQIYSGAESCTASSFCRITDEPTRSADSQEKGVRRLFALLAKGSDFVVTKIRGNDHISAALSAFEKFIASKIGVIPIESEKFASGKTICTDLGKTDVDPLFAEKLTQLLSVHFSNGYRLNSPIELARFRSFAFNDFGEEISLPDEELKKAIAACGSFFEDKVYAVSADTKERIKKLAEDYFADGAQAIFFSEFYAKNENWLFCESVVSEEILIGILRELFPELSFAKAYFGSTNASIFSTLESEILRVWGDDMLLSYKQLAERLAYVPFERIKYALGQNGDFIWSGVETFSHVSRIGIAEEESVAIRAAAVQECNARGYASINDLPLGEIKERNHELSITAVHNAVFRICLADEFDKNGKIITRKGDMLDARSIMKNYCRTIDKCSLEDLLNFEKELTGEIHRWIPMEAGNAVLVRIGKDTYVADRYVHFDSDLIDSAIALFLDGDYLPLKSFTTFAAFPDCGQSWNLFLLESYCRRFSRNFRFDVPSVNSRNAGAVIRKSCGLDYTEIMTDAVVNAGVPLKGDIIGKFLYENGYTGRKTSAKVGEIIEKAKAMGKRKD